MGLAGCVPEAGQTSLPPAPAPDSAAATVLPKLPGNRALSPQVAFGNTSLPDFTEAAVSLHCGATRAFAGTTLRRLLADARAGRRTLILTHYVRTANEIPLGISLLQTADRYPEAMLAMLGLSSRLGRALSGAEAAQFLAGAGFQADPTISASDARLALGLARIAYDSAGLSETPFIREG